MFVLRCAPHASPLLAAPACQRALAERALWLPQARLTLVLTVSAMRTMLSVLVIVAPPLLEMCFASGTKLLK